MRRLLTGVMRVGEKAPPELRDDGAGVVVTMQPSESQLVNCNRAVDLAEAIEERRLELTPVQMRNMCRVMHETCYQSTQQGCETISLVLTKMIGRVSSPGCSPG